MTSGRRGSRVGRVHDDQRVAGLAGDVAGGEGGPAPAVNACRRLLLVLAGAAAFAVTACESTVEQSSNVRPMPPPPNAAPTPPPEARVNSFAMLLLTPKAMDSDGDGRPDTMAVECYLFAEPFPTPLWEEGTFVFSLYGQGETSLPGALPLVEWRISPEAAAAARAKTLIGPCYRFALNVVEAGRADLSVRSADLVGRFEPSDDRPPIRTTGVRAVQLAGS